MINYSEYCAYDENKFVPNLPAPLKKKKPIEEVEVPHKKNGPSNKRKEKCRSKRFDFLINTNMI